MTQAPSSRPSSLNTPLKSYEKNICPFTLVCLFDFCAWSNDKNRKRRERTLQTRHDMKFIRFSLLLAVVTLATSFMTGCSSDDFESSKDPGLKIVGKWKMVKRQGQDTSSDGIYYTFTSDGKMLFPSWRRIGTWEDYEWERYDAVASFHFENGWTYNEKTDEILGTIIYDIINTSDTSWGHYRCIIGRKQMVWVGVQGVADDRYFFERQ